MASCKFLLAASDNPSAVLARAKEAVERQGGSFTGTETDGQFRISALGSTVAGGYRVVGTNLEIEISDKPFFLPCSAIEGFMKTQLAGA